ncbi:hypothetical protein BH11MYX4_BH11MYX4_06070 [soil metagenome]
MRRRSLVVAAVLALVALGVARAATSSRTPAPSEARSASTEASPAIEPERSAPPATITPPTATAIATAIATAAPVQTAAPPPSAAPEPRTTEALIAALDSSDAFVILEAANDLAKRKETRALPALAAIDIRKSPHAAQSVIDALGELGSGADSASRRTATDRLLALLAQERTRTAPESAGNVLAIYSALGRTTEPRAATALEAELVDPHVTLAAKTVIVEALVRLEQPTSAAPLRTLQRQLPTVFAADGLEEEVRRELAGAVDKALQTLH